MKPVADAGPPIGSAAIGAQESEPPHIVLDLPLPVTTGASYRAEACDFWDTVTLSR